MRASPAATDHAPRGALALRAALLVVTAAVALAAMAAPAHAQPRTRCPAMPGAAPSLRDEHASTRLGFLRRQLRRGAMRSRAWAAVWGGTFATAASVQFVRLALSEGTTHRAPAALSAGAAALGVAFVSVVPPLVIDDSARLDASLARLGPHDDACAVLALAETYLVRDAANQARAMSWFMLALPAAFSVGLGLVMGLVFDDWKSGVLQMVMGIGATQLMNLTRPTDAIAALRRYRAGDLRPAPLPSWSYWIAAPAVGPGQLGVSAAMQF